MSDTTPAHPSEPIEPNEQLLRMISGAFMTNAIAVAAKLGISDLLSAGPKSAVELATVTRVHAPSLHRVLRYLASLGIYAETEDQKFELTPMAECLRGDHEKSLRDWAAIRGEEWVTRPHGAMLHSVQSGRPAFDQVFGMNAFEYFQKNPPASKAFDGAMRSITRQSAGAILDAYDFSGISSIADVGGGTGGLLIELLKAHPTMTGVLADAPHVIEGGRKTVEAAGLSDRCQCEPCDFFEAVPAGANTYLLKHIIHDWDDEHAITILKNCRDVIPLSGKLLVIEFVIPPGNKPGLAQMADLEMLVMTPGGRERTEDEFRALFEKAGFELSRTAQAAKFESVIEGTPL